MVQDHCIELFKNIWKILRGNAAAGVGDIYDKRLLRRFAPRNDTGRKGRNDGQCSAIWHGVNGVKKDV